ncbi:hypothetical protein Q3G72_014740 [Acer saccharum]|nr:hypothetical protein Q3G72_014740 [Acer saccharum]
MSKKNPSEPLQLQLVQRHKTKPISVFIEIALGFSNHNQKLRLEDAQGRLPRSFVERSNTSLNTFFLNRLLRCWGGRKGVDKEEYESGAGGVVGVSVI